MKHNFKTSQGMTLVELMVAMVLGLFLVGILATMYLSSKSSFATSTQMSRSQESLRFATSFLKRDVRMAGYTDCSKSTTVNSKLGAPLLSAPGIFGWEYAGTDVGETYTLNYQIINPSDNVAAARTSNSATANQWTSLGSASLANIIHDNSPLAGSDVIVVTQDQKLDLVLSTGLTSTSNRTLTTATSIEGIADVGTIIKIGDCDVQDKFQNGIESDSANSTLQATETFSGGTYTPGNANPFAWTKLWQPADPLYSEKTVIYYVGTGSSGLPALFKIESFCGLSDDCDSGNAPSEIVDGVESMQILYGEDTDTDSVANIYRSADNVTDFNNVVTVRISLLIRSPNNAKQQLDTDNYDMADSITIDVPNQRYLRFVSNETIHLRNMGL